jgi:hypothetical protein
MAEQPQEQADRKYFIDQLKKLVSAQIYKEASKLLLNALGAQYTWLSNLILKYGGQMLLDLLSPLFLKLKRYFPQKKAVENLEKVDSDPNSTVADKAKAYEEMFNSH